MARPVYFDCNATAPVDPRVLEFVTHVLRDEFGNAGSRTHSFGIEALRIVNHAREQVARVIGMDGASVTFTSGATESNNLAILGLAAGVSGRRHIISTQIEHKAVLEPIAHLQKSGFDVKLVPSTKGGWVEVDAIRKSLRPDTLLVSVMHVNNETGVIQPLREIADLLEDHDAYFHTDAAQGFGKERVELQHPRIDLVSVSGHKIYAPMGIGALIARKRSFKRPPLSPLQFGGGQERGLRPGTLPVALIAGLGLAAELAEREYEVRRKSVQRIQRELLRAFATDAHINSDLERTLPSTLNVSFPGLDSEAVILALKEHVAISNGSACTSTGHQSSHVLAAMGLDAEVVRGATRWSWHHDTPSLDWTKIHSALRRLR